MIGRVEQAETVEPGKSPGQLTSHYAPRTLHDRADMLLLPYCSSEAYLFFDRGSRDAWLRSHALGQSIP
ncbi:MAG: hypothetical protein LBQ30_03945, partial [Treponema sp.]|nr:hypothetical protein [Treponema sp.]